MGKGKTYRYRINPDISLLVEAENKTLAKQKGEELLEHLLCLYELEKESIKEAVESLQEFVDTRKNVREWKRGETVRLRLLGFSYREIQTRLRVSIEYILLDKTVKGMAKTL